VEDLDALVALAILIAVVLVIGWLLLIHERRRA